MEIFLPAPPGLESVLAAEVEEVGLGPGRAVPGGVEITGDWPEVWRANLWLRGASRVLVRVASFPAFHLAQLDKRARKVAWSEILRGDVPVRVEATCRKSKIYHDRAAAERIARAISESTGAPAGEGIRVMARIESNRVTLSVDTSGELLHKRGAKTAVAKAPLRETLAALFLRAAGYDGAMPVLDPMCGAGTLVLEAAEWAAGLAPGRARRFAFEDLVSFDAAAWAEMRSGTARPRDPVFHGSDRDEGAVRMARENAARAGVDGLCRFQAVTVGDLVRPEGPPGLVIVNPPYGTRIGDPKRLRGLYASLGERLRAEFTGWRVGLVTSETALARATGLPFAPPGPPIPHGGLKVRLFTADPL